MEKNRIRRFALYEEILIFFELENALSFAHFGKKASNAGLASFPIRVTFRL
jgi:hypothetical protein